VDAVAVSLMMMKVMSVVSQFWTVQSIFCVTHVHSIKGAMNFTTDSRTLPSVTLHVSNPFANRMQMAGIMPHDHIAIAVSGVQTAWPSASLQQNGGNSSNK
jgi:hypothetical protein